jgi:hypothetical protein
MVYRHFSFFLFFLLSSVICFSQPLSGYVNLQNQVMVWDNGIIRKIDYLRPLSMKIGRSAIPYIDNSRSFKIYQNGAVKQINAGFTTDFKVSDNLVTYMNASSLNVFDNGTTKNLTGLAEQYYIGDSVVLYFDGVRREYKAYYGGNTYPIENFLAAGAIDVVKVSDNIIAYDNYANQFRIFYRGSIIQQEDYAVSNFGVGRNTVAYVDINRTFKVFHNGSTYTLEDFPPDNFAVGDNIVAYTSNDGYFKVFYEDSVRVLGFFRPKYQVGDYVVAYQDGSGYLKTFYKGDVTSLESYYPDNYTVQYNSVAYINRAGMLRLFSEGDIYDVTNAQMDEWELTYDVIRYRIGSNLYKIFYKGEEY